MAYATTTPVRFAHIDAAGIVFYPRYFEMLNAAVEDWFASMGADFASLHLHRGIGVPTVKLDTGFSAPSRLGDMLDIALTVIRIGSSSCALTVSFSCKGEERVRFDQVLVCMNLAEARSMPWPEDLLVALTRAAA